MLHCYSVRVAQYVFEQISIKKLCYNLQNENYLYQYRVTPKSVAIRQLKPNYDLMIQVPLNF